MSAPEDRLAELGLSVPEVAKPVAFLLSDEASYISGSVLGVTDGKPVF